MDNRKILEKLGIDLSPANKDARGFFKGFITEYTKNVKKFNSEDVQEYFNTFIAAMMLEYHKLYENFDIQVPYRIKSPKSVLDKVLEYLSRDEKSTYSFNSENEYQGRLNEDLKDMFAITIVACNRPPTFYSRDPEINELIEEKKRNHALLGEVQRFKLRITNDEFAGKEKNSYNFNCSKEEYYLNCIMIVKRIKSLINPNATNLLKKYDNILEDIESIVPEYFFDICDTIISESNKSKDLDNSDKIRMEYNKIYKLIRESDMSEQDKIRLIKDITIDDVEKVDFLSLVDDFTARIHDKLDLAILTKQVHSVFDKSELLSKFEIKIDKEDGKRKEQKMVMFQILYIYKHHLEK